MKVKLEGVVNVGENTTTEEFESAFNQWLESKGWAHQSIEEVNAPYLKEKQLKNGFDSSSLMGGALFDEAKSKRYYLSRIWDPNLPVAAAFLMNPSYADEVRGDGTVDFLSDYLRNLFYGGVIVINTSSIVKSSDAQKEDFPVNDSENTEVILKILGEVETIILGWGEKGNKFAVRNFSNDLKDQLRIMQEKLYVFEIGGKKTKTGRERYPCHPSPISNKDKFRNATLYKINKNELREILG